MKSMPSVTGTGRRFLYAPEQPIHVGSRQPHHSAPPFRVDADIEIVLAHKVELAVASRAPIGPHLFQLELD